MGLDTSYNCWNGPYGSFNRFRKSLAEQIGISLDDYIGYGCPNATKELSSINHDIMPLLNHSDCDGELTVMECKKIVKGLNNILKNFNDKLQADSDFKEDIIQFKKGCLLAIKENKSVEFH